MVMDDRCSKVADFTNYQFTSYQFTSLPIFNHH
jgi:hypothetical protein